MAGYLILLVCVGGPLVAGSLMEQLRFSWLMLIPAAIVTSIAYALTNSLLKHFVTLAVLDDGILIRLPPAHRRRIDWGELAQVTVLDAEESKSVFEYAIREQFRLKDEIDLARYLRVLRKKAPSFRYLSVAPAATMTTRGQMERLTSLTVESRERMVCLKMKNGERLYLSPDDVEGFVEAIKKSGDGLAIHG